MDAEAARVVTDKQTARQTRQQLRVNEQGAYKGEGLDKVLQRN